MPEDCESLPKQMESFTEEGLRIERWAVVRCQMEKSISWTEVIHCVDNEELLREEIGDERESKNGEVSGNLQMEAVSGKRRDE